MATKTLKPDGVRALAYAVPCPVHQCGAAVGVSCRASSSRLFVEPHAARRTVAEANRNGPCKPHDLADDVAKFKAAADAGMPPYDPAYPGTAGERVAALAGFAPGTARLSGGKCIVEGLLVAAEGILAELPHAKRCVPLRSVAIVRQFYGGVDVARDAILNERGALEGMGLTGDQINAVLAEHDAAALATLAAVERIAQEGA